MPASPSPDLVASVEHVRQGARPAVALLEAAQAAADTPANRHAYLRRFDSAARASAEALDALRGAGVPLPVLAGATVSIKDLFAVAGQPTTGGAVVMPHTPAVRDCPIVSRLRRAGAVLTGHTNLSEFAFSGVGINPHHGTPANPAMAALDPTPRVPGGSTSGGATTVASGAALAALGSDTGGSIRIPAALQGLVGYKNTQRLTPLDGVIPLSPTLDTACAITRSVRDAVAMHEVLADRRVALQHRPLSGRVLAVATGTMLADLDAAVSADFERALSTLSRAGAQVREVDLPIGELARLQPLGSFAAAEAWHWHRERLAQDGARYDPRVASRIRRGETMSAADYLELQRARRAWIAEMACALHGIDAVLSPTVPIVAPPLQPLLDDDARFFATNALLLRNPSVVNFLDGCAISLPCQAPGTPPTGLMLWSGAMQDDTLLDVALAAESALATGGA